MPDLVQRSETHESVIWSIKTPTVVVVESYNNGEVILLVEKDGQREVIQVTERNYENHADD